MISTSILDVEEPIRMPDLFMDCIPGSRDDLSSFSTISAVPLHNVFQLADVSTGDEDLATVLYEGEGDHQPDA